MRSGTGDNRKRGAAGGSTEAAAAGIANVAGVAASVKLLQLAHGLYGLTIAGSNGERGDVVGLAIPATHVTGFPVDGGAGVEVFAASAGPAGWLGPDGGTLAVKVPAERGHVLITTYRLADREAVPLAIQIVRLDRAAPLVPSAAREPLPNPDSATAAPADGDVELEIALHIERQGDRRFTGGGWAGNRGEGRRIEAFSVRPLAKLAATEIEYKAYGPGGRETPWVSAATLCGTRGRGIPLTGFAIRLAPHASERFEVLYEGAFIDSGTAGPQRNGEPCLPSRRDDPLEAVHIRLIERAGS